MKSVSASKTNGPLDRQDSPIELNVAAQGSPRAQILPLVGQANPLAKGMRYAIIAKGATTMVLVAADGKALQDSVAEFARRHKGAEFDLVEAVLSARRAQACNDAQGMREHGSLKHKLTVEEANECLIDVFRVNPEYAVTLTCREWAAKLECSPATVHRTPFWRVLAKRKPRGRAGGRKPRRAVALTDKVANDSAEAALADLIQEQARDDLRYRHRKTI